MGDATGFAGSATGFAGRHAVERERLLCEAAHLEAVRESDTLKTSLLRAVSHDLRTPLTAMGLEVESLGRVRVEVSDRGPGIPAGVRRMLQTPRDLRPGAAQGSGDSASGGLGLRIARSFAEAGGLEIDLARRAVVQEGHEIRLTPTELAILELLASHAGRPVTLRQIIATVWKGAPATTADTVRVHVGSLRRKLEPDPATLRYIGTEPWVGYRFLAEEEQGT